MGPKPHVRLATYLSILGWLILLKINCRDQWSQHNLFISCLWMNHNIPVDRVEWWWWLGIASTCTSVSTVPSDVVTMWWFSWSASAPAADESTITLLPWVAAAAPAPKAKASTTTTVRSCDGAGTVVTVLPSTWCHVSTCSYNISTVYLNRSNHSRTTEHNIPTMHHLGIITFPECNFHRNFQDY